MNRYIAMWSGPRNISTAMMRAWGNRPDTVVSDEPLYAHYLLATEHTDHPGYVETIRRHETDWRRVVPTLTGPLPAGKSIHYQKHMAHHVLPNMAIDWIDQLTNCFLIREPGQTLASLLEFLPAPTVEETGLPQQLQIYEHVTRQAGTPPPVVDAKDVLADPPGMLRALCEFVEVPFYHEMLHWPPGPRDTDGAWAPYWYAKVYDTIGFGPYCPKMVELPAHIEPVLAECQKLYQRLHRHRIRTDTAGPVEPVGWVEPRETHHRRR